MANNKYTTLKNIEGYKTLDLNEHIRKQRDDLFDFKQQFNSKTPQDEKFFKAKEDAIKQQQDLINVWLEELGIKNNFKLDVHLMVSEREKA